MLAYIRTKPQPFEKSIFWSAKSKTFGGLETEFLKVEMENFRR